MMSVYESLLIEKMREGCPRSFDAIYSMYAKPLYRFVSEKVGDMDARNDLLQDVFINLWERRSSLEINYSLKAYLYKSVRFKIVDYYRRNAKVSSLIHDFEECALVETERITDTIDSRNLLYKVLSKIDQLPAKMRQIFVLSRFEYLSVNRIAERLSLSPQTVKNQLSKALGILRDCCLCTT